MGTRMHRTNVGKYFSEAARLTWVRMREKGWTSADLARETGALSSTLHRVLYGDSREPSLALAARLQELLGIDIPLWAAAPTEPFILPGAEPTEEASDAPAKDVA